MDLVLTDQGYTVFTADDGGQALDIFRTVEPGIVLTDIKMPVMDGIELLQRIKQESPDTEVIMITGHGDMELAIKSIKLEATDFITKPINNDALEIALKRAHERISMRREIRQHTENLEMLVREQSAKLVEAERLAAVGQVVEGLPSAMRSIVENFGDDVRYFNDLPCFVAIHNSDLTILATNQLYTEKLGNRAGHKSWDIYTNRDLDISDCPVSRTFATGVGQSSRERIRGLQHEIPVVVHTAPIRSSNQDIELVLEMSVDVTEVQDLQEELRTTQARFRQLFEESPCYITMQDQDLRLVEVNRRFREDFGDELGSYCYETYKHRSEPCADCPILRTFEDGKPAQSESVVTSKTGEQYNVLIWTAPIRNVAGETTHVMEMSTNITQIRELQDQLSSLGLLIGSISHGIKGLLTALDGGMYRVDSGLNKNNPALIQSGWETVQLTVDRIKNLVLNILYYAKERELAWDRVDPLVFAKNVALMIEEKMRHHHIDFICDFSQSPGEVSMDPGGVHSALVNILENALDACLADTKKKEHSVFFGVRQDQDDIVFDIIDNGIGMDRETRENIFTLFFSSKGQKGTGLGLFISNHIMQQHGGVIEVESAPGQGSRFAIRIPRIIPLASQSSQTN